MNNKNNKKILLSVFMLIVMVFTVLPVASVSANTFTCVYTGSNCVGSSGGCTGKTLAELCNPYAGNQFACENNPHTCPLGGLNVDYPPIPTPGGVIDLNDEVNEGRITMSAVIIFVYSASLWIAGILAFLALVFAGFAYIMSGANPGQRRRAMERFKNVLWGLGIILVSSVILNIINPQIVTIKDPEGLNVDPGNKQFLGFNFSFETPELIDLIQLCNSFETATDRVDLTNVPSCEWSPAVVESERTEWCNACTQNYGADTPCEQFISDPNTIVCGGAYEEPAPGDRPPGSGELDTQCQNSATNTTVRINFDASPACEFKEYATSNPGGPADADVVAWTELCEEKGGRWGKEFYPDACTINEGTDTIFSCWLPGNECGVSS